MLNIGWFSTGRGEGSRGLLRFVQERIERGQLNVRIEYVFSNRESGEAEGSDEYFQLVQEYGLPLVTLSSTKFRRDREGSFALHRDEYDRQVMHALSGFNPDICVLAGYMLIVGGAMCRAYHLLNLHPALPHGPIGTWQEVIWQLIEYRSRHTGAMVHLATEDVDRGPVLSYCTVPITGGSFAKLWDGLDPVDLGRLKVEQGEDMPLFTLIRQAQYQREPYLLCETLRCVADGQLILRHGDVLNRDGQPLASSQPSGRCLDREIGQSMDADGLRPIQ